MTMEFWAYAIGMSICVALAALTLCFAVLAAMDKDEKYAYLFFTGFVIASVLAFILGIHTRDTPCNNVDIIKISNIERIDTIWRNNEIIGYEIIINKENN